MHVIAKKPLREFWERNPDTERPLRAWHKEAQTADWDTPADVKAAYLKASIIGDNRIVFNIKGNAYRLMVRTDYRRHIVYVRFVGTHADYDRIDAEEV